MKARILAGLALCAMVGLVFGGCKSEPPPPPPPPVAVAPVPVAPPPPPVVTPPPPPATPLVPVANEVAAAPEAKGTGSSDNVDKAIGGKTTTGEELAGNYTCEVASKELPTGPMKLPGFPCIIKNSGDGTFKLTSRAAGGLNLGGTITGATDQGFFVVGTFKFMGNKMDVKSRMLRQGKADKYKGKGRGMLNDDKKVMKQYELTMTRQ
ncbi:MAG: hypothetical protein PHU25_09990 [Deltaproteobacteria bacterium]|nr:hypothetical protein [Deltaproteobacteria bacterium]